MGLSQAATGVWPLQTTAAARQRGIWGLKKGILAMQPYSLCSKFPTDAVSCGEEQA